ncbi:MAG TPA: Nif3-like dinuclear metal center hexameric protein [Myxococcota bacterium]|nr:Nif3-like dinuclear metal center hexameric protein [Myxococcota bacterium]
MSRPRAIRDLITALAARAPFERAADWDPVGLILGDPAGRVRRAAVCHEVTEGAVAALEADPPDLLVSYHPLLFRPTQRLVAGPTPEGRALRLARAGVALAVVHTNFDVSPGGTADALAEALGLGEVEGFGALSGSPTRKLVTFVPPDAADGVLEAVAEAGAAQIGNYTHCSFRAEGTGTFFAAEGSAPRAGKRGELSHEAEVRLELVLPPAREAEVIRALLRAHPYEEPAFDLFERRGELHPAGRIGVIPGLSLGELAERVAESLQGSVPRIAGDRARRVSRVAVVPGSGEDLAEAARAAGADVLVTGDLRHHAARRALDSGLALIDAGHVATERPGLERLLSFVASQGIETASLLDRECDPWSGET